MHVGMIGLIRQFGFSYEALSSFGTLNIYCICTTRIYLVCTYERKWGMYMGAVSMICNAVRARIRTTNEGYGYSPVKLEKEYVALGIGLVF